MKRLICKNFLFIIVEFIIAVVLWILMSLAQSLQFGVFVCVFLAVGMTNGFITFSVFKQLLKPHIAYLIINTITCGVVLCVTGNGSPFFSLWSDCFKLAFFTSLILTIVSLLFSLVAKLIIKLDEYKKSGNITTSPDQPQQ